jgi:hypothetical protein
MNEIQIDGRVYFLPQNSGSPLSTAQRDLYRLIYAIAVAGGKVESHVLMNLLGLKRLEAYEFRLNRLIEHGYIKPTHQAKQDLEKLIA